MARRDNELARYYIGLAGESPEWIELALGNYEQLARAGATHLKLDAQLVLGEIHSTELEWDSPERAALIRNLRALKRIKEVAAVCADTLKPAVVRPALLVIRATCR